MADKAKEDSEEKKDASIDEGSSDASVQPVSRQVAHGESDVSKDKVNPPAEENTQGRTAEEKQGKGGRSAAPRTTPSLSWTSIGITLGVLIALAAIYFGGPWTNNSMPENSGELANQVIELEKRLSSVEKAVAGAPSSSRGDDGKTAQSIASLRKALEGLEKRIEAMSARSGNDVPMTNPPSAPQTSDDAKLRAALDLVVALEERVTTLESGNGAIPDIPFNVTERLVRLEKVINSGLLDRVASLEEVVPDTASHDDLRDVEKRLFKLENKKSDPVVARAARSMAVASLSRTVRASQPFEAELELIDKLYPGSQEVQGLRNYAHSGLESRESLANDFDRLSVQVLRDARLAQADDWSSRLWAWAQSSITIRRLDVDEGESTEAVINRLEHHLAKGTFADALDESNKLDAEVVALDDWRKRLRVRVEAEEALRQLNKRASQDADDDQ